MIRDDKIIRYESKEAWEAEGRRRFGNDFMKWRFVCPMCGHIASVEEFKAVGASSPNDAFQCCLGRFTGKGAPKEGDSSGCNWTVNGLFKVGGASVVHNGNEILIFDYAPVSKENNR